MFNLTPLYLKLKIFQQMVEKLKVQVLALGNELLWKIKSNQRRIPTFCKILLKKNQMHLLPLFKRFFFCMKLYFAMDQGFPLAVCPISLHYDCYFAVSNTPESEGDKNCLTSLKQTICSYKFRKGEKKMLTTNYFSSFWFPDIMYKTKS